MASKLITRMKVDKITRHQGIDVLHLECEPEHDVYHDVRVGTGGTVVGHAEFHVTNPALIGEFGAGDRFYVHLVPVGDCGEVTDGPSEVAEPHDPC